MSWQCYVDSNLVGSGKVSQAAIVGLKGGVWAISPGFNLSTEEQNAAISMAQDLTHKHGSGLTLNGKHYSCYYSEDRSAFLRKDADGAVILKTKQALLVAVHDAPLQQTECNEVVGRLAEYLMSVGY